MLRDRDADANAGTGNLGKAGSGLEQRLYAQQDANHNVTALVDTSGVVVQRFVYDPYGSATVLTANWAGGTDLYDWRYRHQGTRWEPDLGLYDVRHRFYSPALMRWAQADPLGYVDGLNAYGAYLSNPVANVDPSGLLTPRQEQNLIMLLSMIAGVGVGVLCPPIGIGLGAAGGLMGGFFFANAVSDEKDKLIRPRIPMPGAPGPCPNPPASLFDTKLPEGAREQMQKDIDEAFKKLEEELNQTANQGGGTTHATPPGDKDRKPRRKQHILPWGLTPDGRDEHGPFIYMD